jgi:hypothetical protein
MIIDIDGHYTTAPRQLAAWRQRQIASAGRPLVHVSGWLTYRLVEGRQCAHRVAEIRASDVLLFDRPARSDPQRGQT